MKVLTTSLLAAFALPAAADILTLKDGTKLDATILEKNSEEYKLEVNVTKSIKEPRTVKRSDVVKVETTNQADAIFEEEIAGLAPAPAFLDLAGYDSRIKTLKAFLREHRRTSSGIKASKMLTELEEERKLIAAGGIKTSLEPSGLIRAEDREKDAIGIAASVEATKFKNLVEGRSYLAALRQYSVVEELHLGTGPHREILPIMSNLVSNYAALLSRELDNAAQREERRAVTLDQLGANDRQRAIQAEEQRIRVIEALWEKEKEEGQLWLTVDTNNYESLEDTIQNLEKESERLSAVSAEIADMGDLAKLHREGWIAAGEKKQEELEIILDSMEAAGATEAQINVLIDRFDPAINAPPAEEEGQDEAGADEAVEAEEAVDQDESDISE
ncbi:MAG: PTPDL family protein [Roseibacillus sp.]